MEEKIAHSYERLFQRSITRRPISGQASSVFFVADFLEISSGLDLPEFSTKMTLRNIAEH